MPTFLNWPTALVASAVAVPLLLLLYFLKLRRRELDVSSTLLWKKAIQDLQVNAPFQKLRRNLLLLLQLLLLLALLLALSRPIVSHAPGAGKLSVIIIDRSASMSATDMGGTAPNGHSRLDHARKLAHELVDTMEKDSSAMVMAFDDTPDILQTFTSDRDLLKQAIDSIRPTDRRSRLKMAYELAEAKAMAFNPDQKGPNTAKPEVWLYSDGRVLDRSDLSLHRADLKYVKIGTETAPNVGIVAFNARRRYDKPTEVEAFVRIANYGPEATTAAVQLLVDGQAAADGIRTDLPLGALADPSGSQRGVNFNLELNKGAVLTAQVIPRSQDVLPADDTAQVVLPPPRSLRVLLVSPGKNMPLENILLAANVKDPQTVDAAGYEQEMADPQAVASAHDLIIFDRYHPKALPPAGNFLYIASYPPDSKLRAVRDGATDVYVQDEQVMDWDRDHPILRGRNLRWLQIDSAMKLQVPVDAHVLVDGRQVPLIVLYRDSHITHLVIAFNVLESTWPIDGSFPLFFDSAFRYMALGGDLEERQSYQPGATPNIPRYNLQQAGAAVTEIRIDGPKAFGSRNVAVPPEGDFALPPLDYVGTYSLSPAVPQFEKLAVSLLDDNESNLVPVDEQPGGSGGALKAALGQGRLELWWWLVACGAIPLCMIEWWVYTRRVHL